MPGFVIQSQEFDVYINYASSYREAIKALEQLLENADTVEYLKVVFCSLYVSLFSTVHSFVTEISNMCA